ncbi:MAG: hypothetical protein AAGM22_13745 [Acidobacteriota bacterium]
MSGGESSSGPVDPGTIREVPAGEALGPAPGEARSRPEWFTVDRRVAAGALLLLVLACGWVRFTGLSERGLFGSDVVYYTNLAERWTEGDRVYSLAGRRAVYRPAVLGLFAASLEVLGFEDDSIKRLNAGLDTVNVLLVFALTFGLGRRFWPAWSAALVYGLAPLVIYVSRLELTHTISTFFVSLACLLALVWRQSLHGSPGWRRGASAAAAGLASALAVLSHEELLFVGVGLGLWMGAAAWRVTPARRARQVSRALLAFGIPLCLGVSGVVSHHWDHAAALIERTVSEGPTGQGAASLPSAVEEAAGRAPTLGSVAKVKLQVEKTARLFWNAMVASGSSPMAYLVLISLLAAPWLWWRRTTKGGTGGDPSNDALLMPPIVLAVHITLFALFFPYLFPRLFLPLLPLALGAVATVAGRVAGRIRFGGGIAAGVVLLVVVANLEQFSRRPAFMARSYAAEWTHVGIVPPQASVSSGWAELKSMAYRTSWAREIHDAIGDRVTQGDRLLVASSLMYPHPARRELQVGYYFGDRAVYLFDRGEPLAEVIRDADIRYVLFTAYRADRRFLKKPDVRHYLGDGKWSEPRPSFLGAPFGIPRSDFHMGKEHRALMDFLRDAGGRRVYATGTYVEDLLPTFGMGDESTVIYELPADWESVLDSTRRHRSRSRAAASSDSSR